MTLLEITEEVIRTDSGGGIITDENKLDSDFIQSLVHEYRAKAIWDSWQRTRRINPVWTQQFIPEFEPDLQESKDFVKFTCPSVVSLDDKRDGFLYIGTIEGDFAFRKVISRADLANKNRHRFTKKRPKALYSDGFLEIHGNIREIKVDAIFSNPTDIPTYNIEFDNYPISDDILVLMKAILFQTQTSVIESKTADVISDSL